MLEKILIGVGGVIVGVGSVILAGYLMDRRLAGYLMDRREAPKGPEVKPAQPATHFVG